MAACSPRHRSRRKLEYMEHKPPFATDPASSHRRARKSAPVTQRDDLVGDEQGGRNGFLSTYKRRRRTGKAQEMAEQILTADSVATLPGSSSKRHIERSFDVASTKGLLSGLQEEKRATSEASNAGTAEPCSDVSSENLQHLSTGLVVHSSDSSKPDSDLSTASCLDMVPLDTGPPLQRVDVAILYEGPYPSFRRPLPEDCSEVYHRLSLLHGPLEEYAKHKVKRIADSKVLQLEYHHKKQDSSGGSGGTLAEQVQPLGTELRRTVLDSLVGTMLSQNTTDVNSRRAFASLKARFPCWQSVYEADPKDVEDAIRCGGLAEIKASRILSILKTLHNERGKLCLEYIRDLSADEIKLELSRFKGVGPKTIACVLMFHLQQDEFPVDTHVFRITKMLGWVPEKADREKAYLHLNNRIPNHLKFDLHCLFVTHGKTCPRCAKGGRPRRPSHGPCPLVNLKQLAIETLQCDLLSGPEDNLHE